MKMACATFSSAPSRAAAEVATTSSPTIGIKRQRDACRQGRDSALATDVPVETVIRARESHRERVRDGAPSDLRTKGWLSATSAKLMVFKLVMRQQIHGGD